MKNVKGCFKEFGNINNNGGGEIEKSHFSFFTQCPHDYLLYEERFASLEMEF